MPSRAATWCDNVPMTALFAGLTTLDVLHRLDHVPDPFLKVTSTDFTMAAGGPATNAAVTYAALCAASRALSGPEDEAGASSCTLVPSEEAPTLLTALGEGPVAAFLAADLAAVGVRVVDATAPASSPASREPAVSSIIEHPSGRMVASTNARLDADAERIAADLPERAGAVLIDGHNPALAHAALTLGVPESTGRTRSPRSRRARRTRASWTAAHGRTGSLPCWASSTSQSSRRISRRR